MEEPTPIKDPTAQTSINSDARCHTGTTPVQLDGVSERVNREVVLLFGWGRAILLQMAHPLVAAGVFDHSSFAAAPGTRLRRLRYTLGAMIDLSFGTPEERQSTADGINAIHDRVCGHLRQAAGIFARGTPYRAHDPNLLTWVHATLVDSFLMTYEMYVGRLSLDEKNRYCAETSALAPLLQIPEGFLPRSLDELQHYLETKYQSGEIVVTDTGRDVAREVVSPPVSWAVRPLLWLFHLPTRGLLPEAIRDAYELRWGWSQQALLWLSSRGVRILLWFLPPVLRHWPRARRFWFTLLEKAEQMAS